ncbi:uncharacterized protein LOC142182160 [Nicotiana tabacum]|uniref:Uncharacterized protein LOC142182160 n=1 Tax=Nicotiana tabacum TaxID=4097 RepID=A0AC58URX7_TOBAC
MIVFNPLTVILTQNKLEGPNYVDWKRNLDIVLIVEEYKFVLVEVCPKKPGHDATDDEQKAYKKWVKGDEMTWYYILASMSNVLQHQRQSMESTYDILEKSQSSSIRDHILKMTSLLNELEVLEANIDKDTQVEMILQTLPDSFYQFRLNYNMNKKDLSLAKLLNELQLAETIIKQQVPPVVLNFDIGSSASSKPKGR